MRALLVILLSGAVVFAAAEANAGPRVPGPLTTTGKVRLGQAFAGPGLDKAIIRRFVQRKRPRLRRCYERQLAVTPGLSGRLLSTFTIGPQGRVVMATASGVHASIARCVANVIRGMRFPKPKNRAFVPVYYPFKLTLRLPPRSGGPAGLLGRRPGSGPPGGIGIGAPMRRPPARRGAVTFMWNTLRMKGDLPNKIVRRVLRRWRNRLRHCYWKRLVGNPRLAGVIRMRFVIMPAGNVISSAAKGVDGSVSNCMRGALRVMRFPRPQSGGTVNVSVSVRAQPGAVYLSASSGRVAGFRTRLHKSAAGYSYAKIHAGLARRDRRIAGCYLRRLKKNPTLRGKVTAKFFLNSGGGTSGVTAWGMGAVAGCIAHVLRGIAFPMNRLGGRHAFSGAKVTYEIWFTPKKRVRPRPPG